VERGKVAPWRLGDMDAPGPTDASRLKHLRNI